MRYNFWPHQNDRNISRRETKTAIGLLKVAVLGRPEPGLSDSNASFQELLKFGSSNGVLALIAEGSHFQSSADQSWVGIAELLSPFKELNKQRNEKAIVQLQTIASSFEGQVEVLALKGAATILSERHDRLSQLRHLSDIDLLVRPEHLKLAQKHLEALGYRPSHNSFVMGLDYHLPMYCHPTEALGIELHYSIPASNRVEALDVGGLFLRAKRSLEQLPSVLVPSANDRLIHLVWHSMVQHHRYDRELASIRDLIDYYILTRTAGASLEQCKEQFERAGKPEALAAFLMLMNAVIGEEWDFPEWAELGKPWASRALLNLDDMATQRRIVLRHWIRMLFGMPASAESRHYLLALISDPRRLVRKCRNVVRYFRRPA
jgi:hypothetical protein